MHEKFWVSPVVSGNNRSSFLYFYEGTYSNRRPEKSSRKETYPGSFDRNGCQRNDRQEEGNKKNLFFQDANIKEQENNNP